MKYTNSIGTIFRRVDAGKISMITDVEIYVII